MSPYRHPTPEISTCDLWACPLRHMTDGSIPVFDLSQSPLLTPPLLTVRRTPTTLSCHKGMDSEIARTRSHDDPHQGTVHTNHPTQRKAGQRSGGEGVLDSGSMEVKGGNKHPSPKNHVNEIAHSFFINTSRGKNEYYPIHVPEKKRTTSQNDKVAQALCSSLLFITHALHQHHGQRPIIQR